MQLSDSIQYLKGVGEKRAALYRKLGVHTMHELLYHFPRDYIDLSRPDTIADAQPGELCAIRARLAGKGREQRIRAGLSVFKLLLEDDTGEMAVTIFNSKYTVDSLTLDNEYIFYGKPGGLLLRKEMTAPLIFAVPEKNSILPVYPQTAGLTSNLIRKSIAAALKLAGDLPETLPSSLTQSENLPGLGEAMRCIHFPESLDAVQSARQRFVFEELLTLSLALSSLRSQRDNLIAQPLTNVSLEEFYRAIPFAPTAAQLRCIDEAAADLCGTVPMNRLVQGDVGSGKTLVVAACCWLVHQNGLQSAVMAPTEILAEQHYATLSGMLGGFGMRIALLTGSTPASEKRRIKSSLQSGEIDLCIGTHALLSEGVLFKSLAFVATDEQHRFGVAQRAELGRKSKNCHVLVLSATPIPRTLSLIIYGDLSLSVIDELPPGRQPVETLVISSSKRQRALGFIREALDSGRQAYIVCPLVEQGELDLGLTPAVEYAGYLAKDELKGYRVGLLHGRMKAKEKDDVMRRFKDGEVQALVSTTVVEVGVDVPNSTIILIENAERFGLSQLHQLRGRVGRGAHKSWCILLSDARGETARERLMVMKRTSDGFAVAEHDLKLRGPGDFFGSRQHGLPELRVASLADDTAVLHRARDCAKAILEQDSLLELPEHLLLRQAASRMLESVGERPN